MKTPYSSYCINGIAQGCKYCVRGEKLVLFISGKCSRNCWYCSLSKKRKDKDITWANERICENAKHAIEEAIGSRATSAGITGGDPFLFMARTLEYAKALKNKFGKSLHIHIYLPTKLLTKDKLAIFSEYVDEVRFHPEFLINNNPKLINQDINKIKQASLFYDKKDIGIELPMIPDKKQEILDFIIKISPYIGFVNLNEFELSETNMKIITKKYKLNEGGYTIKDSIKTGLWILRELKKYKPANKLKVHLCTAKLKNNFQFRNRLLRHKIIKHGKRTEDGLVKYLVIENLNKNIINELEKLGIAEDDFSIDKNKKRIILSAKAARKLLLDKKYKIYLVEEFPTYDRIEFEREEIKL